MSKNRFQFGRTALICLLPAALLAGCGAKAAQPTLDPTVTVETEIAALDKNQLYYIRTLELLKKYAEMIPPVDEQK